MGVSECKQWPASGLHVVQQYESKHRLTVTTKWSAEARSGSQRVVVQQTMLACRSHHTMHPTLPFHVIVIHLQRIAPTIHIPLIGSVDFGNTARLFGCLSLSTTICSDCNPPRTNPTFQAHPAERFLAESLSCLFAPHYHQHRSVADSLLI